MSAPSTIDDARVTYPDVVRARARIRTLRRILGHLPVPHLRQSAEDALDHLQLIVERYAARCGDGR